MKTWFIFIFQEPVREKNLQPDRCPKIVLPTHKLCWGTHIYWHQLPHTRFAYSCNANHTQSHTTRIDIHKVLPSCLSKNGHSPGALYSYFKPHFTWNYLNMLDILTCKTFLLYVIITHATVFYYQALVVAGSVSSVIACLMTLIFSANDLNIPTPPKKKKKSYHLAPLRNKYSWAHGSVRLFLPHTATVARRHHRAACMYKHRCVQRCDGRRFCFELCVDGAALSSFCHEHIRDWVPPIGYPSSFPPGYSSLLCITERHVQYSVHTGVGSGAVGSDFVYMLRADHHAWMQYFKRRWNRELYRVRIISAN